MKSFWKKNVLILLIAVMSIQLMGCGREYTYRDKLSVEVRARIAATAYLFKNKFGAVLYNVDAYAPFVLIVKDSLYNEAECSYFYRGSKHTLWVNNDDGKIYTDDLVGYANKSLTNRFARKIGLPDGEKVELTYLPDYEIQTSTINDGSTYPANTHIDFFPSEYTEQDVDVYISEDNLKGEIRDIKIYSNRSCMDYDEIVTADKYHELFYGKDVTLYCTDGYVTYETEAGRTIIVTVYNKDSSIYEDRVKLEYYDEYRYSYGYSVKDKKYVVSQKVFTDYSSKDFDVNLNGRGTDTVLKIRTRRDIKADLYVYGLNRLKVKCTYDHIYAQNSYPREQSYKVFNCKNGWKKLVDSRIREIKHRKSGIVPSCNQRVFSFNKDSDYVFDI